MGVLVASIVFIVVGLLLQQLLGSEPAPDVTAEGRALAQRFKALGNMSNLHKNTIISQVGSPNSFSAMSNGELLQWMATGYHIAIMFDDDGYFAGISSEYANL